MASNTKPTHIVYRSEKIIISQLIETILSYFKYLRHIFYKQRIILKAHNESINIFIATREIRIVRIGKNIKSLLQFLSNK